MKDFEAAKELFKDTIHTSLYFDSMSAVIAKNTIEEALNGSDEAPLIFLIGDSGVGKSFILRLLHSSFSQNHVTLLIDYPVFGKQDLLPMLHEANKKDFPKGEALNGYNDFQATIFIDEAHFLNEEQLELIHSLSKTQSFQFVFASQKEQTTAIAKTQHFKSRTKIMIEYGNLEEAEVLRYIQNLLIKNGHTDIAAMFSKSDAKLICRYAKGNFRIIKKFLYTLMKLLSYSQKHGLSKYQKISSCLLMMTALEIGLVND